MIEATTELDTITQNRFVQNGSAYDAPVEADLDLKPYAATLNSLETCYALGTQPNVDGKSIEHRIRDYVSRNEIIRREGLTSNPQARSKAFSRWCVRFDPRCLARWAGLGCDLNRAQKCS